MNELPAPPVISPLDAFEGRMEPTKVSPLYQAGLGVVALAMVLLPVIYIGLIVAMGWAVWWHVQHDTVIFEHARGRAIVVAAVVYAAPAVAGAVFVLFLIKPLFSRGVKPPPPFKLSEAEEPLLFGFVRKICDQVGAPVPREIRLDTQVNASAGFRRGMWSFFGRDLVLVIGTPLVAGMTMRQVAGVLAHEFGHFAQGAGMRFSYIIRRVNAWFARVVFERDAWDDRLDLWARSEEWYLKVIFMLAKGGVWLGRKVLWCLMHAGHAISCFMSRQMEFDADSYEAKLAGSSEFGRTAERLRMLGVSRGAAMNDAYQTFQTRELPDDLAALVLWREQVMPGEVRSKLDQSVNESTTRWNDTHPADPDRVKAALALNAPGVFHLEAPATQLFRDFTATSRAVTRHAYEHEFGLAVDQVRLKDASSMTEDRQAADSSDKALDAFYGKSFHFMRVSPLEWPVPSPVLPAIAVPSMDLPVPTAVSSTPPPVPEMNEEAYLKLLGQYVEHQGEILNQTIARDLIEAGFNITTPAEFSISSSTKSAAESALNVSKQRLQDVGRQMEGYEAALAKRLRNGLDRWREQHADADSTARLDRLLAAQRVLARLISNVLQASRAKRSLELLFANAKNHNDGFTLDRQARAVAQRIEVAANHCVATLGSTLHPYQEGHPPLAQVLRLPDKGDNDFARAAQLADVCTEALVPLLVRVMGDLAAMAKAENP
jgi:Zn-dependent protease with chaperone function